MTLQTGWCTLLSICIISRIPIATASPQVPKLSGECYAKEGDLNIGFFHPIRGVGDDFLCSDRLFSASRVIHVESFVYAINVINSRRDLLPNITLGFVIVDSCKRDLTALARSLYLIPDNTVAYRNRSLGKCSFTYIILNL